MEGLILLILSCETFSCLYEVNRGDTIGIRCSIIVRITVVVCISGIGRRNNVQNHTFGCCCINLSLILLSLFLHALSELIIRMMFLMSTAYFVSGTLSLIITLW